MTEQVELGRRLTLHLILRSLGIASSAVEVVSACAEGAETGVQSSAALWGGSHCDRDVREVGSGSGGRIRQEAAYPLFV